MSQDNWFIVKVIVGLLAFGLLAGILAHFIGYQALG